MFDILTKRKSKARPSRRRLDGLGSWGGRKYKNPALFRGTGLLLTSRNQLFSRLWDTRRLLLGQDFGSHVAARQARNTITVGPILMRNQGCGRSIRRPDEVVIATALSLNIDGLIHQTS